MVRGIGQDSLVVVADPDAAFRSLMARSFVEAGYRVIEVGTGEEALAVARSERPVLVVLDPRLVGVCGYEVCRALKDEFGDPLPVIFVSGQRRSSDRVVGLLVGADDYLMKPPAWDELMARARSLIRRAAAKPPPTEPSVLTRREHQILEMLAGGMRRSEIAHELVISPKTAATHIEHIIAKLRVHSEAQAVARAYREGLVRRA